MLESYTGFIAWNFAYMEKKKDNVIQANKGLVTDNLE